MYDLKGIYLFIFYYGIIYLFVFYGKSKIFVLIKNFWFIRYYDMFDVIDFIVFK